MEVIITQIAVAIVIIALFAYTMKKDNTRITSKDMTMVALLCVLSAVLARVLAIKIPPGQPIFIISLAACVTTTIGILVSPKMAIIAGIIIDVLGVAMSFATGDASLPFLGFTLTSILSVLIPSIMIRKTKTTSPRQLSMYTYGFLVIMLVIGFLYISSAQSISIDGAKNELDQSMKTIIMSLLVLMSVIVVIVNIYFSRKFDPKKSNIYVTPAHLTLILIVTDIITSVIGTSVWLHIMYGLPLDVAMATRIIKTILQLPINVMLIYLLLKYLPATFKTHLLKKQ